MEIVPGARESGKLTRFGVPAAGMRIIPDGPSMMDAATIAERQREGGGAPSERRPPGEQSGRKGVGHLLHQWLVAMRALLPGGSDRMTPKPDVA
jgi:hypothetical protein